MFKIGSVYKTNKLFSSYDKNAKHRYFIYLGSTDKTLGPLFLYFVTTTTKIHKKSEILYTFKAGEYGFTRDCIIIDSDIKTDMDESVFNAYEPVYISQIPNNILSVIYKNIQKSKAISNIIKNDIKYNFRVAGIPTV